MSKLELLMPQKTNRHLLIIQKSNRKLFIIQMPDRKLLIIEISNGKLLMFENKKQKQNKNYKENSPKSTKGKGDNGQQQPMIPDHIHPYPTRP